MHYALHIRAVCQNQHAINISAFMFNLNLQKFSQQHRRDTNTIGLVICNNNIIGLPLMYLNCSSPCNNHIVDIGLSCQSYDSKPYLLSGRQESKLGSAKNHPASCYIADVTARRATAVDV
jgi:hypothetical protein